MSAAVPALTTPRKAKRLTLAERTLGTGLRVIVVRKPGVPLAEVRLRIPALSAKPTHPARVGLLADAMLTGADGLDRADIAAYIGEFGDPFDERDPTALTVSAHYPDRGALEAILRAIDEEIDRIAQDGLEPGELDRVRTRLVSVLMREVDSVLNRTLEFAKFELIYGRAELMAELPARLAAVSEDAVRSAAAELRPERRAVLELIAGGASR